MALPYYPEVRVDQPELDDLANLRLITSVAHALEMAGAPHADVKLFWDSAEEFTSYDSVLNVAQTWVTVNPRED